jgi:hypothetical protein
MYPTRAQPRPSGVSLPAHSTPQNIPTRFARIVQGDIDKILGVVTVATLQKKVVTSAAGQEQWPGETWPPDAP